MPSNTDIDISSMTKEQVLAGVGDLVLSMLGAHRVAVVVMNKEGAITFLNPLVVQEIGPETLASHLLGAWSEEQVESLLEHIYG